MLTLDDVGFLEEITFIGIGWLTVFALWSRKIISEIGGT
jgi:hypothetical protein